MKVYSKKDQEVKSLFQGVDGPMLTNTQKDEARDALADSVKQFYAGGGVKRIITREETDKRLGLT
jgi:hypothetical protein